MTSILDLNEIIKFLTKHPDISINQLYFCLFHHYDEQYKKSRGLLKIERPLSLLYKYIDTKGKKEAFTRPEIEALISKGFIEKMGNTLSIDIMRVTKKFKDEFFGNIDFDEFFELYPSFIPNWNHPARPDINLKSTSDRDKLENKYLSKIKTEEAHRRVLAITAWGKENNQINVNINNYVESEMWDQLEELRSSNELFDYSS